MRAAAAASKSKQTGSRKKTPPTSVSPPKVEPGQVGYEFSAMGTQWRIIYRGPVMHATGDFVGVELLGPLPSESMAWTDGRVEGTAYFVDPYKGRGLLEPISSIVGRAATTTAAPTAVPPTKQGAGVRKEVESRSGVTSSVGVQADLTAPLAVASRRAQRDVTQQTDPPIRDDAAAQISVGVLVEHDFSDRGDVTAGTLRWMSEQLRRVLGAAQNVCERQVSLADAFHQNVDQFAQQCLSGSIESLSVPLDLLAVWRWTRDFSMGPTDTVKGMDASIDEIRGVVLTDIEERIAEATNVMLMTNAIVSTIGESISSDMRWAPEDADDVGADAEYSTATEALRRMWIDIEERRLAAREAGKSGDVALAEALYRERIGLAEAAQNIAVSYAQHAQRQQSIVESSSSDHQDSLAQIRGKVQQLTVKLESLREANNSSESALALARYQAEDAHLRSMFDLQQVLHTTTHHREVVSAQIENLVKSIDDQMTQLTEALAALEPLQHHIRHVATQREEQASKWATQRRAFDAVQSLLADRQAETSAMALKLECLNETVGEVDLVASCIVADGRRALQAKKVFMAERHYAMFTRLCESVAVIAASRQTTAMAALTERDAATALLRDASETLDAESGKASAERISHADQRLQSASSSLEELRRKVDAAAVLFEESSGLTLRHCGKAVEVNGVYEKLLESRLATIGGISRAIESSSEDSTQL